MLLNLRESWKNLPTLMIPVYLFIFNCVFLLLCGFFQLLQVPKLSGYFSHWANRSEPFHRSPIESLTVALPLWLWVEAISNAEYHFQNSERKNLIRPWPSVYSYFRISFAGHYILNYWMGTCHKMKPSSQIMRHSCCSILGHLLLLSSVLNSAVLL